MPVYVSRAHVTIGNVTKKEKKRAIVPRHTFHVSDIGRTPYCFRTLLVTIIGFIIVVAGVILTVIGYKPSILLPWYLHNNHSAQEVEAEPEVVPNVLGEPGDLRFLVYCGPVLMGVGVFSMMVAIVLFCEIKDRYFNNILPKVMHNQSQKDKMYDKVIEEFRKNYFRGIEVPLRPPRKRSKCRFSFSMSPTGSLASFGRRLSHDFQRRLRRASHASHVSQISKTEKITTKSQRPSIQEYVKEDTWMKTSSLPNIRPKESLKSLNNDEVSAENIPVMPFISPSSAFEKVGAIKESSCLDNPAYNDSPPEISTVKPKFCKHASLDTSANKYVTTVIVHQTSNNDTANKDTYMAIPSSPVEHTNENSSSSGSLEAELDIRGIILSPLYNERQQSSGFIPIQPNPSSNKLTRAVEETHMVCTCGAEPFCTVHSSLGMESGDSSLSLSWDNIPSDWNDTRRNTEPVVIYKRSFHNISHGASLRQSSLCTSENNENLSQNQTGSGQFQDFTVIGLQNEANNNEKQSRRKKKKSRHCVFKSDSNLLRVGAYSLLSDVQCDALSLDSLNLTEDILKNFDMSDSTHI